MRVTTKTKLKPFEAPTVCPKCQNSTWNPRYSANSPIASERITWSCARCGYAEHTACADAKPEDL
jgi:predicted nucleic-acid-binding Zn-ribbon protein